jgi:hypothetical protein
MPQTEWTPVQSRTKVGGSRSAGPTRSPPRYPTLGWITELVPGYRHVHGFDALWTPFTGGQGSYRELSLSLDTENNPLRESMRERVPVNPRRNRHR